MPSPPRIGLTTYREPASWGVWQVPADLLPADYADAAIAAGLMPMLLPPGASALPGADEAALDGLHGLVLSGGADVDPRRYRAEPDAATGPPRADRDTWETTLLRAAMRRNMPVLAICRGMQLLNVDFGGTLVQHLPDVLGTDLHCPTIGVHGRHDVDFAPDSTTAALLGERATVATYHHQGLDRLGDGLVATGWAPDGTVEAVETTAPGWVIGVQWHPETFDGARLFGAFSAAAEAYRAAHVDA